MKFGKVWWLGLALFISWTLAAAQTPDQQAVNRERVRENLNNLRLLRMTQALGLTEEQTSKIYPVSTRIEKEKIEIIRKLSAETRGLRELLREANPKDEELSAKIIAIKELRVSLQKKGQEFEDFLETNLNQLQKAKYVIFQAEFDQVLGDRLNRARLLLRNRRRL
jgi:predicted RNase H-like nuclease (RuvC/YqgF family)